MNILVVTAWWPHPEIPLDGNFVAEQVRLLAKEHSVRVIRLAHPRWRSKPRRWIAESGIYQDETGVTVFCERVIFPAGMMRLEAFSASIACARGIRRACQDGWKPDVIHAHNLIPAGFAAVRNAGRAGCPVVITEHSSWFVKLMDHPVASHQIRNTGIGAAALLPVGHALGKKMGRIIESTKIHVVGNIVDTALFVARTDPLRPPAHSLGLRWFSLACLVDGKGMNELIHGFAAHSTEFPAASLVIGGDGPEMEKLRILVRQLKVEEKVTFRGLLTQKQVIEECHYADAFILASFSETFGLAYAEAMACGLPVVATRCGGPEDFVTEETGLLIAPRSIPEVSMGMGELTRRIHTYDSSLIRDRIVSLYSPDVYIRRLTDIYEIAISAVTGITDGRKNTKNGHF